MRELQVEYIEIMIYFFQTYDILFRNLALGFQMGVQLNSAKPNV